ncbi:hypothetical protein TWF730_000391 [Orbilia blumenaviensis]|uniref:Secreted protein n=1 Tax=Orbilia blumenaviensis TaxID=1796055 RepID=A0AAV9VNI7_9PEZI
MKISAFVSVNVALLSIAKLGSAHCFFYDVVSDADSRTHGQGLGYIPTSLRKPENQLDSPVFDIRNDARWHHNYNPNGCGVTSSSHARWVQKYAPAVWAQTIKAKAGWKFLSNPAPPGAEVGLVEYITLQDKAGLRKNLITNRETFDGIPKIKAGGKLHVSSFQVNADGAGPFRCRIDATGQANKWKDLVVSKNCAGDRHSKLWPPRPYACNFTVELPTTLGCTGKYGTHTTVCIVRCENFAINGPFGGCIAVREDAAPKPPAPKPPTTKPPAPTPAATNPTTEKETETVTVTKGNTKLVDRPRHRVKTVKVGNVFVHKIVEIYYKTVFVNKPEPTGEPATPTNTKAPENPTEESAAPVREESGYEEETEPEKTNNQYYKRTLRFHRQ